MKSQPVALLDPRIAAVMAHPTRMFAMTVLFERTASPKEIAAEMGVPVNNVTYHIERLLKLGCIELVRTEPTRGGRVVEHFYRAAVQLLFDEDTWNKFGDQEKADVTAGILNLMSSDIGEAIVRGTFQDPDDNHLSRSPMTLDRPGWQEVKDLLKETLERLMGIQDRVVERRSSGETDEDEDILHARVHIIQFRSPTPKTARGD